MPRTRLLAWSELKIGLMTVFALVMATLLIFLLSSEGGFYWQRYTLKVVFPNIAGLKPGAPVRVAGVEVGAVTGTRFEGDRVEVVIEISRDMQSRVTTTSVASLGAISMLGEAAVDLTASSQGTPIPEWGYLTSGPTVGSIAEVTTKAATGIDELTGMLRDTSAGRGTLGRLFTDDALFTEVQSLLASVETVVQHVNQGRGTLGRLANDPAAAKALEASLQNVEAVTARIRAGEGSLGKLLSDDTLATSLASTTTNLDTITGRISRGEGTAGKLVSDTQLYDRLNAMSNRLDKVMAGLEQGQGTAGQMLKDGQLYENMNGTMSELKQLVQDIRANPRKFLNVRVSLF